ncbi:MAG TPA: tRNA (adenosine(37)-N6)-threonylcarbamoyltransferase complex transferase subunit TsaD [Coriobacteriia bacterium]|nr:tRNA (adenosine(37)-N6)-threonylcarbamoyltransferase complex transferase subunit TsaD [Coriobacteriia bacterium]
MSVIVAFDTATDVLAVGIGKRTGGRIVPLASVCLESPRKANELLLVTLDEQLGQMELSACDIEEVVVGRGPGSFTGVRIGVATAKGLAQGLGAPLYGIGTLDAIAWRTAASGELAEGALLGVVGDAMRGEVYPALFRFEGGRMVRLTTDTVAKPGDAAASWAETVNEPLLLAGNGLAKYAEIFAEALGDRAVIAPSELWAPDGAGLLAAYDDAASRGHEGDGVAALVLPVYTRLSDAEEAERARLGLPTAPPPESGVAGVRAVRLREMAAADIDAVRVIEVDSFADAWTVGMFLDELSAPLRQWVVAEDDSGIVGYGGIAVFGDDAHIMNLAVRSDRRGQGLGAKLLQRLRESASELGPRLVTLEVRESNAAAIALYESAGLCVAGRRPRYYNDTGEDALIMWGPSVINGRDAGVDCSILPAHDAREDEERLLLAVETSCDETAAAVIRGSDTIVADVVASQIDFHARFGGVVPEIASRKHTEAIVGVVAEAMDKAGESLECGGTLPFSALDGIVVTYGPGLVGALVVGLAYAKGLSLATGLPLVGVNHLEGHIFANVLADERVHPPIVALVVSGGHTSLVHMPRWGVYRTMGETLDDAAGEAFDKVAKVLGLGYPGGPILSKLAAEGNPAAIDFPRAMMRSGDYAFSLSGLKTAVINHIRHEQQAGREINIPDLAASFQAAVVDVQVAKAVRAVKETGAVAFCLAGGVAANPALREALRAAIEPLGVLVSVPPFSLCTDNAAMIAAAGHYRYLAGERLALDADADPSLRLDTPGA